MMQIKYKKNISQLNDVEICRNFEIYPRFVIGTCEVSIKWHYAHEYLKFPPWKIQMKIRR